MRHRTLALSAVLIVTLAACGSGTASPSPSPSSVAPPATPATPAPSLPAPSSSSALAGPSASNAVPHGAPTLEVNLPRAFRGKPLFMLSFGPAELAASPAGDSFNAIITAAGGDVTRAGFAVANDSAVTQDATFNAFAVSGAGGDGTKLVNAYVASAIAGGSSLSSTTTTLGGKAVTRIKSSDDNALGDSWVYAIDDVMYGVQSKDEALATEVIGLLP
jgi:hypothetical protein